MWKILRVFSKLSVVKYNPYNKYLVLISTKYTISTKYLQSSNKVLLYVQNWIANINLPLLQE